MLRGRKFKMKISKCNVSRKYSISRKLRKLNEKREVRQKTKKEGGNVSKLFPKAFLKRMAKLHLMLETDNNRNLSNAQQNSEKDDTELETGGKVIELKVDDVDEDFEVLLEPMNLKDESIGIAEEKNCLDLGNEREDLKKKNCDGEVGDLLTVTVNELKELLKSNMEMNKENCERPAGGAEMQQFGKTRMCSCKNCLMSSKAKERRIERMPKSSGKTDKNFSYYDMKNNFPRDFFKLRDKFGNIKRKTGNALSAETNTNMKYNLATNNSMRTGERSKVWDGRLEKNQSHRSHYQSIDSKGKKNMENQLKESHRKGLYAENVKDTKVKKDKKFFNIPQKRDEGFSDTYIGKENVELQRRINYNLQKHIMQNKQEEPKKHRLLESLQNELNPLKNLDKEAFVIYSNCFVKKNKDGPDPSCYGKKVSENNNENDSSYIVHQQRPSTSTQRARRSGFSNYERKLGDRKEHRKDTFGKGGLGLFQYQTPQIKYVPRATTGIDRLKPIVEKYSRSSNRNILEGKITNNRFKIYEPPTFKKRRKDSSSEYREWDSRTTLTPRKVPEYPKPIHNKDLTYGRFYPPIGSHFNTRKRVAPVKKIPPKAKLEYIKVMLVPSSSSQVSEETPLKTENTKTNLNSGKEEPKDDTDIGSLRAQKKFYHQKVPEELKPLDVSNKTIKSVTEELKNGLKNIENANGKEKSETPLKEYSKVQIGRFLEVVNSIDANTLSKILANQPIKLKVASVKPHSGATDNEEMEKFNKSLNDKQRSSLILSKFESESDLENEYLIERNVFKSGKSSISDKYNYKSNEKDPKDKKDKDKNEKNNNEASKDKQKNNKDIECSRMESDAEKPVETLAFVEFDNKPNIEIPSLNPVVYHYEQNLTEPPFLGVFERRREVSVTEAYDAIKLKLLEANMQFLLKDVNKIFYDKLRATRRFKP